MKWGEEKRALLGSFFLIEFFSTASSSVCIFFSRKGLYILYIYIYINIFKAFFILLFFSSHVYCARHHKSFSHVYTGQLFCCTRVFTGGSSNILDPSTVRRELCHGNVHIGDGGTTAMLQQGVFFFKCCKTFSSCLFFYRAIFEIKCVQIAVVVSSSLTHWLLHLY